MKREGYTLVEILVVVLIIGILISLTLPAINAARAAARRMQCQNNLKQFGIAFAAHETTYNGYPPTRSSNGKSSWSLALLPFMEQGNIWAKYDQSKTYCTGKTNQMLMRQRMPLFQCPATPLPDRLQYLTSGNACAYVPDETGISADGNAQGTCTDYYTHHKGISVPISGKIVSRGNPLAGFDSITPQADITDGVSNTIVLNEMAGRPNRWAAGKRDTAFEPSGVAAVAGTGQCGNQPFWCSWGGCASQVLNIWDATGQKAFNAANFSSTYFQKAINATNDGVYSFHPGGSNSLFMDGSVKFISEMILPDVFLSLNTKDGGETFQVTDMDKRQLSDIYPDKVDPTGLGRF